MLEVDRHLLGHLKEKVKQLEKQFTADLLFYYGEIDSAYENLFRDCVEELRVNSERKKSENPRIAVFINTPGGSAETVEKLVTIIRHHYKEVYFVVPDYAMSAGTILCMSGDKIYMDYASSLGPIDPQVRIRNKDGSSTYIPALGYLDKVNEMLMKSAKNKLTNAEFVILQGTDLGLLRSFEQARELTESLLKQWLIEFKFKSWDKHETDPKKKGKPVTSADKKRRAQQIAKELSDNKKWHSHGRNIDIKKLKELRIKIEDYSNDKPLTKLIRGYNDVLTDYIAKSGLNFVVHTKHGIEIG